MNAFSNRPSHRRTGILIVVSLALIAIAIAIVAQNASTSRRAGDETKSMIVSDISLTRLGTDQIQAMVEVKASNSPVGGAELRVKLTVPSDRSFWIRGRTASNGRYVTQFPSSEPGKYTLEVTDVSARGMSFDKSGSPRMEATLTLRADVATPIPTATADDPTPTEEDSTATEEAPTATEEAPTATEEAPTATEEAPTATEEAPTATSDDGGSALAGQPCPNWVHDQYVATGPDGRLYPTWHPPVDPASGCTFDHEHGDNPNGNPAMRGRNVVFCYLATFTGNCMPHTGYKVFAWENISSTNGPAHNGASVVMVLHQGTSVAGRFTTPFHDIEIHYYNPEDGREAHIYMLAPFGDLLVGCGANDPDMELRLSQADAPGARQVAADKCFNSPNIPYEDWITALYVGTDSQGSWTAYMDPHFAVFNPNTYCIVQGSSCQLGYSDERAGTGADPLGTDAWYKGDRREAYLNQVWINNAGGTTTIWTDAYGRLVPEGQGIPQYLSAVNRQPLTNSAAFGADHDHDPASAVHAPN